MSIRRQKWFSPANLFRSDESRAARRRRKAAARSSRAAVRSAKVGAYGRRTSLLERLETRDLLTAITVNTLNDVAAVANPTLPIDANGGSEISLRSAIAFINANASAAGDTITFAAGLAGTITLSQGELPITAPMTVTGPGASVLTVSGNNQSRIFDVNGGAPVSVSISGLTLTGGNAMAGGAIYNNATLTLSGDTVSGNSTVSHQGAGGGIFNDGTVISTNDAITGNSSGAGGGGIANLGIFTSKGDTISENSDLSNVGGGGIYNVGPLSLTNDTINGNSAAAGGGLYSTASMTAIDDTFTGNSAQGASGSGPGVAGSNGEGGAIYSTASLILSDDTISGNTADGGDGIASRFGATGGDGQGGGVYSLANLTSSSDSFSQNSAQGGDGARDTEGGSPGRGGNGLGGAIYSTAAVTSVGDTFSGNAANAGNGGGGAGSGGAIYNNLGALTLVNDTISGNVADTGSGGIANQGALAIANDLVVGNTAGGVASDNVAGLTDENGPTHNIIGLPAGVTLSQVLATDSNGNPLLTNNGGPTQTIALVPGSPAIGAAGALTTLSAAIADATSTTLTVVDPTFLAVGDALWIDQEIVVVAAIDTTTDTITVARGQDGTAAAPHAAGAPIYLATDARGFIRTTQDIGAVQGPQGAVVVNTLNDVAGANAGSPFDANGNGEISLRSAVAYLDTIGGGTITFNPALFAAGAATVDLTSADPGMVSQVYGATALPVTGDITIVGPGGTGGLTIQRDATAAPFRLFTVDGIDSAAASLTLENLTLTGGDAVGGSGANGGSGAGGAGGGGGAGLGGAVSVNGGGFIANDCTFVDNQAVGGGGGGSTVGSIGSAQSGAGVGKLAGGGGGGVGGGASGTSGAVGGGDGATNVRNTGGDGGFGGGGGGAANDSSSKAGSGGFAGGGGGGSAGTPGAGGFGGGNGGQSGGGGGAGLGGALFSFGGAVSLTNDTFTENTAAGGTGAQDGGNGQGLGGAIFTVNGPIAMTNSTLWGNTADNGGAVYAVSDDNPGTYFTVNQTPAGGWNKQQNQQDGSSSSSISSNPPPPASASRSSSSSGGAHSKSSAAGPANDYLLNIDLMNSVLGGTTSGANDFTTAEVGAGTIGFAGSNNLIETNSSAGGFPASGLVTFSPGTGVGALGDYGGPTPTMPPTPSSAAIGAAAPLTTLATTLLGTDSSATVTDPTFLAVGDYLRIDSEIVLVTGINGDTVALARGQLGTTPAEHDVVTGSPAPNIYLATDQRGLTRNANPDIGAFETQVPTTNLSVQNSSQVYNGAADPVSATVVGLNNAAISSSPNADISFAYYQGALTASQIVGATALPGAPVDAGTYTVVATFTSDIPGYRDAVSAPASFSITPATPSISVTDEGGMYIGTPYAATGSVTGVNGDTLGTPTFTYYLQSDTSFSSPLAGAPTNAGDYVVVASFTPPGLTPATLQLAENYLSAEEDVASAHAALQQAVSTNAKIIAQLELLKADLSLLAALLSFEAVGSSGDYLPVLTSASFSITQAPITYQIGDDSQIYGSPANLAHDLGTTISTGVNGETLDIAYSSLGDTPTANVVAGGYQITGLLSNGTGLTSNYSVTLYPGTLTVNPAPISYTMGSDYQAEGIPANLASDLPGGFPTGINGQTLSIGGYTSAGDTAAALPGNYAINGVVSDGTGLASNYQVALTPGTLTVEGPGATQVGGTLYLVGGNTDDQINLRPFGTSNTGSTGIQLDANLAGIDIDHQVFGTTTPITSIVISGFGGNDNIVLDPRLTIPVTVVEGDGNDNIALGNASNSVIAGDGNDNIFADGGNNTITAGNGNDNVQLGVPSWMAGFVRVLGGNGGGDDPTSHEVGYVAQAGNNIVTLGTGNDNVSAGDGNNVVTIGNGNDSVNLGNGNNQVTVVGAQPAAPADGGDGRGHDDNNDQPSATIQLGNGNNTVAAGESNLDVNAGNGNNTVTAGGGNDQIVAGDGNNFVDVIVNGNQRIQLGNGDNSVIDDHPGNTRAAGNVNVQLGNGNNNVRFAVYNGGVFVTAGNGSNTVVAGNGNDSVQLGVDDDWHGQNAPTTPGNNLVALGNGNDQVQVGDGNNTVGLGFGNDQVRVGDGNNNVTLADGQDSVQAGDGNNTIDVGSGNDRIQAGDGTNVIIAGGGNDNIQVGDGDNLIVGGGGHDQIRAGNGNNILIDGSVAGTIGQLWSVLDQWMADIKTGDAAATIANDLVNGLPPITYNTANANTLSAGRGFDAFFATYGKDHVNAKPGDLLNGKVASKGH
jgi:hypothetical protein